MNHVTVRFLGGPADGAVRDLPTEPDGRPPAHWVLSQHDDADAAGINADHLYERAPDTEQDDTWTMRYVRTDPLGMSE
ncbi:hypothetical protein GCM10027290_18250 [Micromonospora sonneratiae]|uniref:Uncharacterized protein n=1 Tax=Micromonospora sonneratiae TaxID=1184706 RepID=A0ABW3Y8P8_9ACTN